MQTRSVLAILILLAPALAAAQDFTVRPDPVGISATRAQTNALGADLSTCLVLDDPSDPLFYLDTANHFDCVAATTGGVTDHTVLVPEGGGNVTVWAVTVRQPAGVQPSVSDKSPFSKTVEDVPAAPLILAGHPALAADLA